MSDKVIPRGINRDERPNMRDLHRNVVRKYAVQWERLGLELGLDTYSINVTSANNAYHPRRVEACCAEVLTKWLEIDPSATWGKLDDAIQKTKLPSANSYSLVPTVSNNPTGSSSHLKHYYISTRFRVEDDIWPPVQPKHYTPLMLVHQLGQWSKQEANAMAVANVKGHIEEYLFTTGSKTTKDLQEVFSLLDQPVSSEQARVVLVEGQPGIGKSVLLKHIAYLWATNKLLTSSSVLLLLYLRDPAVHEINSLHDLVHHFFHYDKIAAEFCMAQISKENGKLLTILLDGYDEFPYYLQQCSFVADILRRKILPACAIVVSSRPHASTKLCANVNCRIEILGFSEDDQKHYIEQSLKKEPDKIPVLNDYLKAHPVIASLCYTPFYMTVLLFLYIQEKTLPTSYAELFNLFICITICHHLTKRGITIEEDITNLNLLLQCLPLSYKNIITKLSKFAYKALENNQLVFTRAEIMKQCPEIDDTPGAINGFGLLQAVEYVGRMNKTVSINFLHLSVQEFLAANYISNLSPDEEFSILEEKFWETKYLNMFTFYITLTKAQHSSFKKFLSGGDDTIAIHRKFLNDDLKCIHLHQCFNEAIGNDNVCRTIERKFSNGVIRLIYTTLSTNHIENISIFLTCCSIKQWKLLDLGNCRIRDAGLLVLHQMIKSSSITIEQLWLYNNDLSSSFNDYLTDIVITCRVKWLDISNNKAIVQTEEFFCKILSPSSSMIEQLYIYNINLSSRAAIMILTLLKEKEAKLKRLGMADNDITDDACNVIAETLQVSSTLEYLSIYGNKISKEASQLILNSLMHNNTLTDLRLPNDYSDDDKQQILKLQDIVNEERKHHKCQVKLNVKFSRF